MPTIDELQAENKELKKQISNTNRLDSVSKFLSSVLIPLSIALAGSLIGKQMKDAEIAAQNSRAENELSLSREKATSEWKVSKAELIKKFLDDLCGENEIKKKLAIQAMMVTIPEDGPKFAQIVLNSDASEAIKSTATTALDGQVPKLVNDVFSPDKQTRVNATNIIISGWLNNRAIFDALLNKAIDDDSRDGMWNTVIILENASPDVLRMMTDKINRLEEKMARTNNMNNTLARLRALKAKR